MENEGANEQIFVEELAEYGIVVIGYGVLFDTLYTVGRYKSIPSAASVLIHIGLCGIYRNTCMYMYEWYICTEVCTNLYKLRGLYAEARIVLYRGDI